MANTPNLNLVTYSSGSSDQSGSFLTWTQDMSGSTSSNMTKIDAYAGGVSGSITNLSSSMSGSITTLSGSITNISGSITSILADIVTLNTRFYKIGEFSGGGQANFNNISGSYTHLLLMGVTSGSLFNASYFGFIGIDFNGDANQSNYGDINWYQTQNIAATEVYTSSLYGAVNCGFTPDYQDAPGYGIPFFAIIPNYSASGGLYKSAFGISAGYYGYKTAGLFGGFWRNTSAITRVRVFALAGSAFRFNFYSGTKITLYGIG